MGRKEALENAKSLITRSRGHADLARGNYNKNKSKMDAVDDAQTLAMVSIAESLAAANELLLLIVEV